MPTIIRPTIRVNEFGVKAFSPHLADEVTGCTVEVRDWYGAARFDCTGAAIGNGGYPTALEFVRADGKPGRFSLHTAREIEILP